MYYPRRLSVLGRPSEIGMTPATAQLGSVMLGELSSDTDIRPVCGDLAAS